MTASDSALALTPVVEALERLGVAYYVGGSVASSAYGVARSTLDVDLLADLQVTHVRPLAELLMPAYYVDARMIAEAVRHKSCFNVIHLTTMFKVDVFVLKQRDYDRQALARVRRDRVDRDAEGREFLFAAPEDVILSKLEWFRLGDEVSERQWGDLIGVLRVQGPSLDRTYLERWAADLGLANLLDRAWREVSA